MTENGESTTNLIYRWWHKLFLKYSMTNVPWNNKIPDISVCTVCPYLTIGFVWLWHRWTGSFYFFIDIFNKSDFRKMQMDLSGRCAHVFDCIDNIIFNIKSFMIFHNLFFSINCVLIRVCVYFVLRQYESYFIFNRYFGLLTSETADDASVTTTCVHVWCAINPFTLARRTSTNRSISLFETRILASCALRKYLQLGGTLARSSAKPFVTVIVIATFRVRVIDYIQAWISWT